MEKPVPGCGLNLRRGGAKLRALGKAHRPLHILLWQAHEVTSSLTSHATAQSTLFTDIANWASSENRALSDVCAATSDLFNLYANAQIELALAFKSFRKDMALILEGEKRCDAAQKKLQEAESKRLKLRRQLLRVQNRTQVQGENVRRTGDLNALQTQLAEAERNAERTHTEACDVAKEQEAVKLVVIRTALTKLCQSKMLIGNQTKVIFDGAAQLANEIPDPPPPGDQLSCMRYNGFNATRSIVSHVKRSLQRTLSTTPRGNFNNSSSPPNNNSPSSPSTTGQLFIIDNHHALATTLERSTGHLGFATSTPVMSPIDGGGLNSHTYSNNNTNHQYANSVNGHHHHQRSAASPTWATVPAEPSAPSLDSSSYSSTTHEPPPPYNVNYVSPRSTTNRRSRNSNGSSGSSSATRRRYQNVSSVAPCNSSNQRNSPNNQSNVVDQIQNNSLTYYNNNTREHHENGNTSLNSSTTRIRC